MQGLGGTGAQQSKECSFAAGSVGGAPLRVSWFLVIFFVYQLIDAVNSKGIPVWVRVAMVTGNEFLLLLTVLCHEMGHGTMARRRGGEIAEVLLWPFGGICFTTRAQGRAPRQKLVDDLWIVGAGPATHFPMAGIWVTLVAITASICSHVVTAPAWSHLVPFANAMQPCFGEQPGCFHTWVGWLFYNFLVQAVQMNVMLFMFNVFFPMYPMDGAKLIVCSLQLFCGASARCAAKVLIYTSTPLAVLFIGYALMGLHGGGLQPGITLFMGLMCLSEAYKIHTLMKEERLYTHPLFELARSSTRDVVDPMGVATRLNTSNRDDEEMATRLPQVQFSELRPFSGQGRALGGTKQADEGAPETQAPSSGGPKSATVAGTPAAAQVGAAAGGAGSSRAAWLDQLERQNADRGKSVRELEEERIQQMERERLTNLHAAR